MEQQKISFDWHEKHPIIVDDKVKEWRKKTKQMKEKLGQLRESEENLASTKQEFTRLISDWTSKCDKEFEKN
jgi:hypothetical protein